MSGNSSDENSNQCLSPTSPPSGEFGSDPQLISAGWERRFMADPLRAQEVLKTYTDLGFEVRMEQMHPESFGELCKQCSLSACQSYVMIYTRKR